VASSSAISPYTIVRTTGTSTPELAVNVLADDEIVFGNVIGSNNFNLLAILGVSALISPIMVNRKTIFYELPLSILVFAFFLALCNDTWFGHAENQLTFLDGLLLLVCFGLFLWYIARTGKSEVIMEATEDDRKKSGLQMAILIILGLGLLVGGGQLIVVYASKLAAMAGVSETVIGLTIVSMGTSLPELASSVAAARKNMADIAIGNVVGSNLFNILLIMGVSSLIDNRSYSQGLNVDVMVCLVGTLVLAAVLMAGKHKKLGGLHGIGLTASFALYMLYVMDRELGWW
jgi:cation:H+ antiporter